jgi:hypothetical protein
MILILILKLLNLLNPNPSWAIHRANCDGFGSLSDFLCLPCSLEISLWEDIDRFATCGEIGQKEEGKRVVGYGPVEQGTLVKLAALFRGPLKTKQF